MRPQDPKRQPGFDQTAIDTARAGLKRAEAGHRTGADEVEKAHAANPVSTEAAEQEASDGPGKRGLSR